MTETAKMSLNAALIDQIRAPLKAANARFNSDNPGAYHGRQPAHTVYGGAQLFKAETARKMGETAIRSLEEYAPNASKLATALGQKPGALWETVYERVVGKLRREAVEDFRIDFEDGYGTRPDDEEDTDAARTAVEVAQGMKRARFLRSLGFA